MLEAHHDGSEAHLSDPNPELGDAVTAFVRIPAERGVTEVNARLVRDGEPLVVEAVEDRRTEREHWWRVEIPVDNPLTRYRFHLRSATGTTWVNGSGEHDWDVPDGHDFTLSTEHRPPDWPRRTVWYQIFPDRFARRPDGRLEAPLPGWATERPFEAPVRTEIATAMTDIHGGSLNGITANLDHLAALGVNGIYTCPVFPARSNHRYDASTFDTVDPLLGGDEALRRLVAEAADRGMRIMGDLTTNHSGAGHEWFRAAVDDPEAPSRSYYYFGEDGSYESWLGVPSLPKLDQSSAELRAALYEGPDSVAGRHLGDEYGLAALRIDVANMTGRLGAIDLNDVCSTAMRATIDAVRPDAWLLAEHAHDASGDLHGRGWHGTMNYAGFSRPVWSWLRQGDQPVRGFGEIGALPRRSGVQVARSARAFLARIPFSVALSNMNLLGSHDSARWAFVAGSPEINQVGMALLCTWPGSPSILYGDEIGAGADSTWDVTTRLPFPWHAPELWDRDLMARYRELIELRRSQSALAVGGMRWVRIDDDHLVYVRQSATQQLLVHVARAAHDRTVVDLGSVGAGGATVLAGTDQRIVGDRVTLSATGPSWSVLELHAA